MKVSNKNARPLVESRSDFDGANTFARNDDNLYIVYSYGYHWPMFIYSKANNMWYENISKYSSTTSKQTTQLRPNVKLNPLYCDQMKEIIHNTPAFYDLRKKKEDKC